MNNFVQFLLDYYVWILVVLGIIIITIIGFLVDSKQKRKKKEQILEGSVQTEVKTVEPLPEVAVPIMDAKNQSIPNDFNNVTRESIPNQLSQNEMLQPNLNKMSANENITLSEQRPRFESREVKMPSQSFANSNMQNDVMAPRPVNPVYINQVNGQSNNMQMANSIPNVQPIPPSVNNNPVSNGMFNSNNVQSVYQNSPMARPINTGYNNQTINYPNQMSNVQQQPVSPIPNVPFEQVVATPIQNMEPTRTQEQVQFQPNNTIPNIGINFVTGVDSNNNQVDDTWKL